MKEGKVEGRKEGMKVMREGRKERREEGTKE
jgi:hypothetical protein